MSVQGLDVNMATSSGAQGGGVDTSLGIAEKPSLYIWTTAAHIML